MRYLYLIALAIFLAMPTEPSLSEEPTADQRLGPTRLAAYPRAVTPGPPRIVPIAEGLFKDSGLAKFQMRGGRLRMDPVRYRKGNQDFRCDQFQETMSVSCSNGVPSAAYHFEDDFQKIRISVQFGRCFRMESTIHATGESASLEQDHGQLVQWRTRRSQTTDHPLDTEQSGWTILHIIAADESGFRLHFDHLFERMLKGRGLVELTHQTHRLMCKNTSDLMVVTETDVMQLVEQLSARKSSIRRDAAIQLSRLGASAIPHLYAALREKHLDAEQVARIGKLLANESRLENDTPSSLACLLSADQQHWQLIANRLDRHEWLAANDHIRNCQLQPLQR